jgi:hypothetical protein
MNDLRGNWLSRLFCRLKLVRKSQKRSDETQPVPPLPVINPPPVKQPTVPANPIKPSVSEPAVSVLDDAFERLLDDLVAAGFRMEESFSSSTVTKPSGQGRDCIHRTHRIYRGESAVGKAIIIPREKRAELAATTEAIAILEPMFSAYRKRAFGIDAWPSHHPLIRKLLSDEESDRPLSEPLGKSEARVRPTFPPTENTFLPWRTCPFCKGHGGWGGLSEPFVRCSHCEGTGKG